MTQPAQYISGRTVQEQMDQLIGYVDTRAAEVATDAIASDVAQVHQDMLDADADASAAAASAAAAAGTLANAVKKTGEASQTIAGDVAVSGDLDVGGDADITGALDVTGAITGNDASLIGTVTVPTEVTGTFTMKAANSTKVKNELDNYAPMVRTTGDQNITGHKYFGVPNYGNGPNLKDTGLDITDIVSQRVHDFNLVDNNNVMVAGFRWVVQANGTVLLQAQFRKTDGTTKFVNIGDNS